MGMRNWSQNGYGFDGDILDKFSTETKVAFTKKYLPDLYENIAEDCEFLEDWEEYFNFHCGEEFDSDSFGLGAVPAAVYSDDILPDGSSFVYCF